MQNKYLMIAALCGGLLIATPRAQATTRPAPAPTAVALAPNLVPIPDAEFRALLQSLAPNAFVGNEMDTTHPDLANISSIQVNAAPVINSLEGVQYLKSLVDLSVFDMPLGSLPALPPSIIYLTLGRCQLTSLPALPPNLFSLYVQFNQLNSLPALPSSLGYLNASYNPQLASLPALPASLVQLEVSNTPLGSLPALPAGLRELLVPNNSLTSLPALPAALVALDIQHNQITSLPALPALLESLGASFNQLTALPTLPAGLRYLYISSNPVAQIPQLPSSLSVIEWANVVATCVPNIPSNVNYANPALVLCTTSLGDLTAASGQNLTVSGNYNDINVLEGGVLTLTGTTDVAGTLTVESGGRLNFNGFNVTGTGDFVLNAGGTLDITSAQGISFDNQGNVQVSGSRTFNGDATFIYSGNLQVTGNALPVGVTNLTASASTSLTMTRGTVVSGLVDVTAGQLITNGNLVLFSNASKTASLVTPNSGAPWVAGNVIVTRYVSGAINSGDGYRHLSFPVLGASWANVQVQNGSLVFNTDYNTAPNPAAVTPFPTVFGYDPGQATAKGSFTGGWYAPASRSALGLGLGYSLNVPGNNTLSATGQLLTYSVNYELADLNATTGSYVLLGNPYTAPFLWSTTLRSQVAPVVYMAQSTGQYAGRYSSYVAGTGVSVNGGTDTIPSGAGYFVQATGNDPIYEIELAGRVRAASARPVYRQAAQPLARFELMNGTVGDESVIHFHANATAGFDTDFDANRMPGGMALYTHSSGKYYSINSNPESFLTDGAVHTFALGYTAQTAGTHTIKLKEVSALDGQVITLIDNQLNTATVMNAGDIYSFQAVAGSNLTRFVITIGAQATSAKGSILSGLSVFPNPAKDRLEVSGLGQGASIQLINAVGQTVRTANASYSTSFDLNDLAAGVYTLRIAQDGQTATQKVVKQ